MAIEGQAACLGIGRLGTGNVVEALVDGLHPGPRFAQWDCEHFPPVSGISAPTIETVQEIFMYQNQDQAGTSAFAHSSDRSVKDEVAAGKSKVADLAQTATDAGKKQLDAGLHQAAGQVDTFAKAVDDAANRLKSENQEGLASFASHVASSITSLADRLRDRSVDDLANDARDLARTNPAMFLAGSVAVGFGLTRFLKASSRISGQEQGVQQNRSGSTYGDSRDSAVDTSFPQGRSAASWPTEAGSRSDGTGAFNAGGSSNG